jgi:hypothetical protein
LRREISFESTHALIRGPSEKFSLTLLREIAILIDQSQAQSHEGRRRQADNQNEKD